MELLRHMLLGRDREEAAGRDVREAQPVVPRGRRQRLDHGVADRGVEVELGENAVVHHCRYGEARSAVGGCVKVHHGLADLELEEIPHLSSAVRGRSRP